MKSPFVPDPLPPPDLVWDSLISGLGRANRALAGFNGILYGIRHPQIFLSPLTTQEAVLSSKIEGTQATLGEVLKFEAGEEPESDSKRQDFFEILNYRKALHEAQKELTSRPFNLNLLLKLHSVLLDSVRGLNKGRGSFRTTQNWIGSSFSTIENASFIPPVPELVRPSMNRWESYYHCDERDLLVQLAILHAQFEIIHPFLDGNGRLGRIIIPIFLYEKGLLSEPVFYLSSYFEKHREEYIAKLKAIGQSPGAWNAWVEFFLLALTEQATENTETARKVLALYARLKDQIRGLTHSQFAVPMLDALFETPVFSPTLFEKRPGFPSKQATMGMLGKLKQAGILTVLREASGRTSQILAFPELLNLCEGRDILSAPR